MCTGIFTGGCVPCDLLGCAQPIDSTEFTPHLPPVGVLQGSHPQTQPFQMGRQKGGGAVVEKGPGELLCGPVGRTSKPVLHVCQRRTEHFAGGEHCFCFSSNHPWRGRPPWVSASRPQSTSDAWICDRVAHDRNVTCGFKMSFYEDHQDDIDNIHDKESDASPRPMACS